MDQLFDANPDPAHPPGRTRTTPGARPLAARMRPDALDKFGQEHLLREGSALRVAIEQGKPHSMLLYGPPG